MSDTKKSIIVAVSLIAAFAAVLYFVSEDPWKESSVLQADDAKYLVKFSVTYNVVDAESAKQLAQQVYTQYSGACSVVYSSEKIQNDLTIDNTKEEDSRSF